MSEYEKLREARAREDRVAFLDSLACAWLNLIGIVFLSVLALRGVLA